jgi:hypothetical protein
VKAAWLLCATQALGCASRPLDRSVSIGQAEPSVTLEEVPVRGHEVDVLLAERCHVRGELFAVDSQYVWVKLENGKLYAVPPEKVRHVELKLYPSESGAVGGWTALGAVSTLSHGGFLIISLPVWLISGIASSTQAAAESKVEAEQKDVVALYQYARFPQGLPPALRQGAYGVSGCTD